MRPETERYLVENPLHAAMADHIDRMLIGSTAITALRSWEFRSGIGDGISKRVLSTPQGWFTADIYSLILSADQFFIYEKLQDRQVYHLIINIPLSDPNSFRQIEDAILAIPDRRRHATAQFT